MSSSDPAADGTGTAGHLVFVIDGALPPAAQQACADAAVTLAAQTGMPVTVATAPVARLGALRETLGCDTDVRCGIAPGRPASEFGLYAIYALCSSHRGASLADPTPSNRPTTTEFALDNLVVRTVS